MAYLIYGSLVYSTQANRNSALTAINNAIAGYDYTDVSTTLPAGINTSGTTVITISIELNNDADVDAARMAILGARTSATRGTSGQYIATVRSN